MKTYCNNCKIETNQRVIHEIEKTIYFDPDDDYTIYCYQIIECEGCNNFSYRTLFRDKISTEIADIKNISPWKLVETLPECKKDHLKLEKVNNLPLKINKILSESVCSFNNNCFILCAAGIRTIIESIHSDQIDSKIFISIDKKIIQLAENGILTKKNSLILQDLKFIGNKALHELRLPTEKELKIALEIIEITLSSIYHLESKSNDLKRTIR